MILAGGVLVVGVLAGKVLTGGFLAVGDLAGADLTGGVLDGGDLAGGVLVGEDLTVGDLAGRGARVIVVIVSRGVRSPKLQEVQYVPCHSLLVQDV